jgi:hypothetical protein
MNRTVLSATDFSADARQAAERAALLCAGGAMAGSTLLHVMQASWLDSVRRLVKLPAEAEAAMLAEATAKLGHWASEIGSPPRLRAGAGAGLSGRAPAHAAAGGLSAGRHADRPGHAGLRRRRRARRPAGRDRRDAADVRRRPALLAGRPAGGAQDRVPGAIVQMAVATAGRGRGHLVGLAAGRALVFGLSLSVASTVVLLRALESRGHARPTNGRIAVGWLVVEDLAMVLVLVLLPALAPLLGGESSARWPDGAGG